MNAIRFLVYLDGYSGDQHVYNNSKLPEEYKGKTYLCFSYSSPSVHNNFTIRDENYMSAGTSRGGDAAIEFISLPLSASLMNAFENGHVIKTLVVFETSTVGPTSITKFINVTLLSFGYIGSETKLQVDSFLKVNTTIKVKFSYDECHMSDTRYDVEGTPYVAQAAFSNRHGQSSQK